LNVQLISHQIHVDLPVKDSVSVGVFVNAQHVTTTILVQVKLAVQVSMERVVFIRISVAHRQLFCPQNLQYLPKNRIPL